MTKVGSVCCRVAFWRESQKVAQTKDKKRRGEFRELFSQKRDGSLEMLKIQTSVDCNSDCVFAFVFVLLCASNYLYLPSPWYTCASTRQIYANIYAYTSLYMDVYEYV